MVQGLIFEGGLQFSKLFTKTICKGVHITVHWKTFHPAYALPNVFFNTSFKNYPHPFPLYTNISLV
jgi:hypothetical protein